MTIYKLTLELAVNTTAPKMIHDFKSGFTQISSKDSETIWSGNIKDLGMDELHNEVIPSILEKE